MRTENRIGHIALRQCDLTYIATGDKQNIIFEYCSFAKITDVSFEVFRFYVFECAFAVGINRVGCGLNGFRPKESPRRRSDVCQGTDFLSDNQTLTKQL